MPNVLITGANRGLGLEFAKQYSDDGWNVVTTIREPSPELESLGVQIEHLDMADLNAVASFGERLNALDLLVANAGTYGPKEATNAEDAEAWLDTIRINTVAPYLLARSVQPLVEANRGKLIAVSTKMGSIEDNSSGGFLAYRSSKTALNMAWRNLALDVRRSGAVAAMLHPGWVQTRMGGSSAPLTPEESIAGMRRVIDGLGKRDSGGFFAYDGSHIPW
jgi:NAD(P)-dependent dehydrogenase (short-subunit alcohol dehydrogenase family)